MKQSVGFVVGMNGYQFGVESRTSLLHENLISNLHTVLEACPPLTETQKQNFITKRLQRTFSSKARIQFAKENFIPNSH
jgi:hypothetical protein